MHRAVANETVASMGLVLQRCTEDHFGCTKHAFAWSMAARCGRDGKEDAIRFSNTTISKRNTKVCRWKNALGSKVIVIIHNNQCTLPLLERIGSTHSSSKPRAFARASALHHVGSGQSQSQFPSPIGPSIAQTLTPALASPASLCSTLYWTSHHHRQFPPSSALSTAACIHHKLHAHRKHTGRALQDS
jgi:hypothetical protein